MPSANRNEGEGAAGRSITVEMSEYEAVRAAFETLVEILRTILDMLRVLPGSEAMVGVLKERWQDLTNCVMSLSKWRS